MDVICEKGRQKGVGNSIFSNGFQSLPIQFFLNDSNNVQCDPTGAKRTFLPKNHKIAQRLLGGGFDRRPHGSGSWGLSPKSCLWYAWDASVCLARRPFYCK